MTLLLAIEAIALIVTKLFVKFNFLFANIRWNPNIVGLLRSVHGNKNISCESPTANVTVHSANPSKLATVPPLGLTDKSVAEKVCIE